MKLLSGLFSAKKFVEKTTFQQEMLVEACNCINLYLNTHHDDMNVMDHASCLNFKIAERAIWGENRVGWTDGNGDIWLLDFIVNAADSFLVNVVAHELTHAKQYKRRFGVIRARGLGRWAAEKQALAMGTKVEKWCRDSISSKLWQ